MKRIGVFGGNFNPIHNGHLITAMSILEQRELEIIIFIPAFISPLKTSSQSESGVHRLNMTRAAITDFPFFSCSDIELSKGGISYTIDTLRLLTKEYTYMELIIGMDNLEVFTEWKDPEEIVKLADLVVLKRITSNREEKRNRFFDLAYFADTPVIQISSTEIRERIRKNLPIDFLVPESVKKYITDHNLYKD